MKNIYVIKNTHTYTQTLITFRNHDPIIYLIGKISFINIQKKKKKKPP